MICVYMYTESTSHQYDPCVNERECVIYHLERFNAAVHTGSLDNMHHFHPFLVRYLSACILSACIYTHIYMHEHMNHAQGIS